MKRSIFIILLFLSGFASHANAEGGDQYWLLKAGVSFFNNADKPDSMRALNISYGYRFINNFAAEIDYQQTLSGGDYNNTDTGKKGDYSYKLGSIGVAYRYVFYERLYFRGKLAVAYGEEKLTVETQDDTTDSTTNLTGSLALGVLAGDLVGSSLTLELEYRQLSSDLSAVMLGANVTF